MPIWISHDPGANGAWVVDWGRALSLSADLPTGLSLPHDQCPRFVTEGQTIRSRPRGSTGPRNQDILTLAQRAGIAVGKVWTRFQCPCYVLPVRVWKDELFRGGATITKKQCCERIYRLVLTDLEKQMVDNFPKTRRLDALDTFGILRAAQRLDERGALEPYALTEKDGLTQ